MNRKYTITKEKPYFTIPLDFNKEFIQILTFKPDLFNPADELQVVIKKELKDSNEFSDPLNFEDFSNEYIKHRRFIELVSNDGERYLLISLLIGKTTASGKFMELEKMDPDRISDFKISLEYKYPQILVKS